MGEDYIPQVGKSKTERYQHVLEEIEGRFDIHAHPIGNLSNAVSLLHQEFNFWWVGYYVLHNGDLSLGPFQGPVACTRIFKGKGVCGVTFEKQKTHIVPDVNKFQGHIACSSSAKSQIVLPIVIDGKCYGVLDIDSDKYDSFDQTDQIFLQKILNFLIKEKQFDWLKIQKNEK